MIFPFIPLSYRPYALLNCDYELISKLVNNEMKRFLETLTKRSVRFCQGLLYIGDTIRLLIDIVDYTELSSFSELFCFKAFDSLKWDFVNFQQSQAILFSSNIRKLHKHFEDKELNWPSTEIKYTGIKTTVNNFK